MSRGGYQAIPSLDETVIYWWYLKPQSVETNKHIHITTIYIGKYPTIAVI